jgi:hypothetical protein
MATTYDISMLLATTFVDKSRPVRQEAFRAIINTRMAEEASIRKHIIKIITAFEEVLGATIHS